MASKAEAGDEHAGDRAGAEGDGQAALQAGARRLGGADVGADRDVHADEAGGAREQRADHEAAAEIGEPMRSRKTQTRTATTTPTTPIVLYWRSR